MLSTFVSYKLIARDIPKAIDRIERQPTVDRETKYYLENIGKVSSIDEFVKDDRLFKYAMKAFGLQDMSYARAFMVKALKEGVTDPDSFANKLTDKRYAEFVSTFNFAKHGDAAMIYNKAQQATTGNYAIQASIDSVDPEIVQAETDYYMSKIADVKSIDDLFADARLYDYALRAYALDPETESPETIRKVLEGGASDPASFANTMEDKRYAALASAFDFAGLGEKATTWVPTQENVVDKYLRQTLEEDAGNSNEGVRLALYFQRKAGDITDWYQVLADKALASVVRTAFGLPESFAKADIDRQVKLFESRMNIEDFANPAKLEKFLTRFTSLHDAANPSTAVSAASILFAQPAAIGVSTDLLMAMQQLKSR